MLTGLAQFMVPASTPILLAKAKAEAAASHLAPLTKRGTPRQRAPKGSISKQERERIKSQKRRDRLKAAKLKAEGKSK